MSLQIAYKGLVERNGKLTSGYDSAFVYEPVGKWTHHPAPDVKSKESCGIGLHACYNPLDCSHFVPDITHIAKVQYTGILGKDKTKVRAKSLKLLKVIPYAELRLIDERYAQIMIEKIEEEGVLI